MCIVMAEDNFNGCNLNSTPTKDSVSDESFVKKVRSRVTELLPTSLSKWFSNDSIGKPTIRQREDDEDDSESFTQPPSKRVKLPNHLEHNSTLTLDSCAYNSRANSNCTTSLNNINHFPLPVPVPSGISTTPETFAPPYSVKRNAEKLSNSDKDSESEDSTSGYSSTPIGNSKPATTLEYSKRHETSTINPNSLFNTSFGQRSLFSDTSPQLNSSLSSRRPSFNASTFGSPSFVDRTLSTQKILSSPFYNGRTIYGGASANKSIVKSNTRNDPVHVKPVGKGANSAANTSLSKTARRILDTLEQYTSSVAESRKIPNPRRSTQPDATRKYTAVNPYVKTSAAAGPARKELQVPRVPELLKMKLKERMQDSTVAAREIATASKSALNVDEYKLRSAQVDAPKHSSKIRSKISAVREQKVQQTVAEPVKLPDIVLPITDLPKFDFSLPLPPPPPPAQSKPIVARADTNPVRNVQSAKVVKQVVAIVHREREPTPPRDDDVDTGNEYKFATPLIISNNWKAIVAINEFKFSEPLMPQRTKVVVETTSVGDEATCKRAGTTVKRKTTDATTKTVDESHASLAKCKPNGKTWECTICLLANQGDAQKCWKCRAPKTDADNKTGTPKEPVATTTSDFGSSFKMAADQWACPECFVRNNNTTNECIACNTRRKTTTPSAQLNGPTTSAAAKPFDMAQFTPGADTWQCPSCLITNKNTLKACAACGTAHANGAPPPLNNLDAFKPASDRWECGACMLRNKPELVRCAACENANPNAPPTRTGGFGDVFKRKDDEWECTACMVRNANNASKCAACETPKGGADAVEAAKGPSLTFGIFTPEAKINTHGFTFGIPPGSATTTTEATRVDTVKSSFTFGVANAEQQPSGNTFKFGIPATATNDVKEKETVKQVVALDAPTTTTADNNKSVAKVSFATPATVTQPIAATEQNKPPAPSAAPFNSTDKKNLFGMGETPPPPKTAPNPFNGNLTDAADKTAPAPTKSTAPTSNNLFPAFQPTQPSATTATDTNKPFAATDSGANSGAIFGGKPPAQSTFLFDATATGDKPKIDFGSGPAPINHNLFAATEPAKVTFGAAKPTFASLPAFKTFGDASANVSSTSTASDVKPFTFGAAPTPAPATAAAQPAPMFSFGQSGASVAGATNGPTFGFGASASTQAAGGGFAFGSTPSSTFQFGGVKPIAPPTGFVPAPTLFGANAAAAAATTATGPAQHQQQPVQINGGFNFGNAAAHASASHQSTQAGFNFGARPAPTPGVFSFGGSNAQASGTGGFNFGAAANPPSFNADAKPSFKFSDGSAPTFSAQQGAVEEVPTRKKIKGIRRTHR